VGARRAREEAHRQLAGARDPLVREVRVEELREVRRRHGGGEPRAVVGERLVVVSGEQADGVGALDDELQHPQQHLEPVGAVVEQVAEEDEVGAWPLRLVGEGERRLEREQVPVQVADEPEGRVGREGAEPDGAIGLVLSIGVEEEAGSALAVEQRLHARHGRVHARAHAARVGALPNRCPVERLHLDRRRHRGRLGRRRRL
jgi:hypothetical protein